MTDPRHISESYRGFKVSASRVIRGWVGYWHDPIQPKRGSGRTILCTSSESALQSARLAVDRIIEFEVERACADAHGRQSAEGKS